MRYTEMQLKICVEDDDENSVHLNLYAEKYVQTGDQDTDLEETEPANVSFPAEEFMRAMLVWSGNVHYTPQLRCQLQKADQLFDDPYRVTYCKGNPRQELKQSTELFGGAHMLLFGDLMQLPSVAKVVGGSYCFKQPDTLAAEPHLWRILSFCELSQSVRQENDSTFVDILNSIRVGRLTVEQLSVLDIRSISDTNDLNDVIRIYPIIRQADHYNNVMTENLGKYTKLPVYDLKAVDTDLVNGAIGTLEKIDRPEIRRDQLEPGELPSTVLIKFDDPTIRPDNLEDSIIKMEPMSTEFDRLRGSGKILRKMLPLILCWAVIVYKLQGSTLEDAVVDLGKHIFAKGKVHVALSRKSLERASQKQSIDTHKTPYDRAKRCRERKINITASESVNRSALQTGNMPLAIEDVGEQVFSSRAIRWCNIGCRGHVRKHAVPMLCSPVSGRLAPDFAREEWRNVRGKGSRMNLRDSRGELRGLEGREWDAAKLVWYRLDEIGLEQIAHVPEMLRLAPAYRPRTIHNRLILRSSILQFFDNGNYIVDMRIIFNPLQSDQKS
ncbi:hypothetical protein PR048_017045 [Dryococelus australis]|uniref:ATP-dependent DNA helicase n=1 Tax=Dryococelus australis TaxID=614101 RepID=A0ABQ9H8E3_9NEOP|nr:hypothetical protein PR048_017045 [Dryococelus australis]